MRGSIAELLIILIVAGVLLLAFGAKKIPELAKSLKQSKEILVKDDDEDKDGSEKNVVAETTVTEIEEKKATVDQTTATEKEAATESK